MKISTILQDGKYHLSGELFPPKAGSELHNAVKLVQELKDLEPSYISVTYGAAGSGAGQSLAVAEEIERQGLPALSHLTCIGSSRENIGEVLVSLRQRKVQNILALRGDLFNGVQTGEFTHANELVEFIKKQGDFCVGAAAYPEGHPEAGTLSKDLENIKRKVDAGVDFLVTQMFFDNNLFYRYALRLLKAGIEVPVVPGLIALTNKAQVQRIGKLSGAKLPPHIISLVDKFGDKPEVMKQVGIAFVTSQIVDLFANGFNNVHVFTMNKPEIFGAVAKNLAEILK